MKILDLEAFVITYGITAAGIISIGLSIIIFTFIIAIFADLITFITDLIARSLKNRFSNVLSLTDLKGSEKTNARKK